MGVEFAAKTVSLYISLTVPYQPTITKIPEHPGILDALYVTQGKQTSNTTYAEVYTACSHL